MVALAPEDVNCRPAGKPLADQFKGAFPPDAVQLAE
jgi:hypothetical protein